MFTWFKRKLKVDSKKRLTDLLKRLISKTKDFLNAIDFLIDQDCKIKTKVNGKNVECD